MPKYAIQTLFGYGWDYVGSDDKGERLLFDSMDEARDEAKEARKHDKSQQWRAAEYYSPDDTKSDL